MFAYYTHPFKVGNLIIFLVRKGIKPNLSLFLKSAYINTPPDYLFLFYNVCFDFKVRFIMQSADT